MRKCRRMWMVLLTAAVMTICAVSIGQAAAAAGAGAKSAAEAAAGAGAESQVEEAASAGAQAAAQASGTVLEDGCYLVRFDTDSSMFHVNEANEGQGLLTVKEGRMTLHISLVSKKITCLYAGLAADAVKEGAQLIEPTCDRITYSDGWTEEVFGFDLPVPAIGEEFDLAILGSKGTWYDHKVSVSDPVPGDLLPGFGGSSEASEETGDAEESQAAETGDAEESQAAETAETTQDAEAKKESLLAKAAAANAAREANAARYAADEKVEAATIDLADGIYSCKVTLEGGSGKASISSPAEVTVKDGQAVALIEWSSASYDYMIANGDKLTPVNTEGNSRFKIPVICWDEPMAVIGDTTAMSQAHEVSYTLTFDKASMTPAEEAKSVTDAESIAFAESSAAAENSAFAESSVLAENSAAANNEETPLARQLAAIAASVVLIGSAVILFIKTKQRKDREDKERQEK